MCIAIVVPAGKVIPDNILKVCQQRNRDGSGFAYVHKGKIKITKGLFTFEEFLPLYKAAAQKYGAKHPMLVHFRVATQGAVTDDNCHPFPVDRGALIHNGSFWHHGGRNAIKSDTREFCEELADVLGPDDFTQDRVDVYTSAVNYNKIAVLHSNGNFAITNPKSWVDHEGILFSHGGFKVHSP